MKRKTRAAIAEMLLYSNPELCATLKGNHDFIAGNIANEIVAEYSFVELADIMGWKKTRVRR